MRLKPQVVYAECDSARANIEYIICRIMNTASSNTGTSHGPAVRILEKTPNRVGDLFARLMRGLFLALGYDKARLNIHKAGREIDLVAEHRIEPRRVIAECKATATEVGGADVNKFVGSLDAEIKRGDGKPTSGYFVSLSGFTATAIEQEKECGGNRVILLSGSDVVRELIAGRIVAHEKLAIDLASRLAPINGALVLDPQAELAAHEIGWIWIVYFSIHEQKSHFALIHADGNYIAAELAEAVVEADRKVGGVLHALSYLTPPTEATADRALARDARNKYFAYLEQECGEIQLEGLPADQEVGARKFRLENLFVPLHLVQAEANEGPQDGGQADAPSQSVPVTERFARRRRASSAPNAGRLTVGQVIEKFSRIAILGLPGGGKSTLLKRLASAYAFPERRRLINDRLPDRPWLPLFIRCRRLGELVNSPILEVLNSIASRAEIPPVYRRAFAALVSNSLRDGTALLLIDGLDEISNDGERVTFTQQLRTFLAVYPKVALAVTSREAGFRVIGGALRGQCEHFRLDDFNARDIKALTVAWHTEVIGESLQIRSEAEKLSQTISNNDRLLELAANPLLLTTLMLVKRWVGQLPSKRTVLYAKAIEVLLMTWNVEGHQPLDPDEVMPQLEYLAFFMMKKGLQVISAKRLGEVLASARAEMPEVLSCTRMTVSEFTRRVELRSSLLMWSGHIEEDGELHPAYEFRHLTFQEYLAARAIAEGHHPDREDTADLLGVLKPHLDDETWSEVVPLAAVLSGRQAQPLILELTNRCRNRASQPRRTRRAPGASNTSPAALLAACLSDEVQIPPEPLKEALKQLLHWPNAERVDGARIGTARYGGMLYEVACEELRKSSGTAMIVAGNIVNMFKGQMGIDLTVPFPPATVRAIDAKLDSDEPLTKTIGCLAAMELAWYASTPLQNRDNSQRDIPGAESETVLKLREWNGKVLPLRNSCEPYLECAALWAAVWTSAFRDWTTEDIRSTFSSLVPLWMSVQSRRVGYQYLVPWLIKEVPMIRKSDMRLGPAPAGVVEFIRAQAEREDRFNVAGATICAYYMGNIWADEEIKERVLAYRERESPEAEPWVIELANLLGLPRHEARAAATEK